MADGEVAVAAARGLAVVHRHSDSGDGGLVRADLVAEVPKWLMPKPRGNEDTKTFWEERARRRAADPALHELRAPSALRTDAVQSLRQGNPRMGDPREQATAPSIRSR